MNIQKNLIHEGSRILRQGVDLVSKIDDRLYVKVDKAVAASSIGGHVRHCLDNVNCLLDGLASGRVDYDRRDRDERVENERDYAKASIERAISRLESLPTDVPHELEVKMDCPVEEKGTWSRSSLERELQSVISHTVHHFALIAFLARLNGHETPPDFGVAHSTLVYWEENEAAQKAGNAAR